MNIKKIIYCLLTLAFLVACLNTFIVYTSLIKTVPWYENSGMQFISVLLISSPIMLTVGLAYRILGKYIRISRATKRLPFIAMLILVGLPFLDGGLGQAMQVAGAVTSVIAFVASLTLGVKDLIKTG